MTTEGTSWSEFAKLMPDPLIRNKDRDVFATIMNRNRMSNPDRYNGRSAGPSGYHTFLSILIQTFDFPKKVIGHERTFFEGACHKAKSKRNLKNDDEECTHYCTSSDDGFLLRE